MITKRCESAAQLTVFACEGAVTVDEISAEIRDFYQDKPTLHTAWDFTDADLAMLTAEGIVEIAQLVRSAAHSREGGRTALIFPLGQLMQMGDRFASIGQIEVAQAKIKIFDSWDKAQPWLGL